VQVLLDDLDKELAKRGHAFCRHADDCNIYVVSKAAGGRMLAGVTRFLETKLRLRVNREKSAAAPVRERKFPGHRLLPTHSRYAAFRTAIGSHGPVTFPATLFEITCVATTCIPSHRLSFSVTLEPKETSHRPAGSPTHQSLSRLMS